MITRTAEKPSRKTQNAFEERKGKTRAGGVTHLEWGKKMSGDRLAGKNPRPREQVQGGEKIMEGPVVTSRRR